MTIGNFDGVHLGHQALLSEVQRQSRSARGPAVAVTFSQHPLSILRPEAFQPELTTLQQRVELLAEHGADHVIVLETSRDLLNLSARAFFEQIIRDRLRARTIVEGFNFGFGHNREGSIETLQSLGREVGVNIVLVPAFLMDGKPVSSSRVRNELLAGRVAVARAMLGRCFRLSGVVKPGQKRGQTIGFPTANLADVATLVPGDGVYAATVLHEGKAWPAAVNIGANPTFGEQTRKIEAHLIGFHGDLYGEQLDVDFVERLRDTRPFAGVEELTTQLQNDVGRVKQMVQ